MYFRERYLPHLWDVPQCYTALRSPTQPILSLPPRPPLSFRDHYHLDHHNHYTHNHNSRETFPSLHPPSPPHAPQISSFSVQPGTRSYQHDHYTDHQHHHSPSPTTTKTTTKTSIAILLSTGHSQLHHQHHQRRLHIPSKLVHVGVCRGACELE